MTVNFYLDTTSSAILLVVQHKGKKFRISTGIVLKPATHWDSDHQRVKSSYRDGQYKQANGKELYEDINGLLESKRRQVEKIITDYQTLHHTIPPMEQVKQQISFDPNERGSGMDWNKIMDDFIEFYKETKAQGTYKKNQTFIKLLREFHEKKKIRLELDRLNKQLVEAFKLYMVKEKKYLSSTVKERLVQLMTLLNWCKQRGYLQHYDDTLFKYKVIQTEGDRIYLNEKELQAIEQLKGLGKSLEKVRDSFLFQCETGLRYSDVRTLKPTNLLTIEGEQFVQAVMHKTKRKVVVPLSGKAQALLNKYRSTPQFEKRCLPSFSKDWQNDYIKQLGQKAAISNRVEVISYNGNQRIEEQYEKWELMSTHTGRRTFATNYILKGGRIEELSNLLGHTNINTTQGYLRHTPEVMAFLARRVIR